MSVARVAVAPGGDILHLPVGGCRVVDLLGELYVTEMEVLVAPLTLSCTVE